MLLFGILFSAILGLLVGSFLNVCIDRLPAGQSLLAPPSHCPSCNRRLSARDLIPVFSYLSLRGKCRTCGAPIPQRLMWVELGTGILFAFFYWHFGLTVELAMAMVYTAVFVVLSVIDLDHQLILNVIVYPTTVVALAVGIFIAPSRFLSAGGTGWDLPSFLPHVGIVQALIGAAIGLIVFTLIIILSRGGMGWGDAKMAMLIGAMTGYLIPLAIFLAVVIGGLLAVFLLVTKIRKRKQAIPFGPFLAIGGLLTILWGNSIANWYLGRW